MKYIIKVCRISYSFAHIPVEAGSPEEAEAAALGVAGDYVFSEKSSAYSAQGFETPPKGE